MKFIDLAKIIVRSGAGGKGHISFRHEKFVPKGGPDGGNGGKGGNITFFTDPHLYTLLDFKYKRHFYATDGSNGGKSRRTGKDGKSLIIRVPCGTVIKNAEEDEILLDMATPNKNYIFLEGGKGGRGNSEFATPTHQTPRFSESGISGTEMEIVLELKSIADVGIVGFPNSGKSTLISVISAAKPKIADYPFTTLIPNLGIVKMGESQSYTVADIPGIIEGASDGKGLGFQFLRHIERTKILLFLIDACSENPLKDYKILANELKKFNPILMKNEKVIAISKADLVDTGAKKKLSKIKFEPKSPVKIFIISSITGEGLDNLKWELWNKLESLAKDTELKIEN
jgi:GTPase